MWHTITTWLTDERWAALGQASLVLLVGWTVATVARRAVRAVAMRRSGAQTALVAGRLTYFVILFVAMLSALRHAGLDLSVLLGAAGIFTVAIGFASQTSASNVISGLFLLFERPFVVGDTVEMGGLMGVVLSVDFMSVKMRTFDNQFVRVPNETVIKSTIVNVSYFPVRRYDVPIRIGFDDDYDLAYAALVEAIEAHPLVLEEPAYRIFVKGYGEAWINLQVSVWATRENFWDMRDDIQIQLKRSLDRAGVRIALPHRVVHTASDYAPGTAQSPPKSA